jgi:uncharacterized membrane protein (DUF2068 family)
MRAGVDEAALRAVITYKWVKGAAELLLFLGLALTLAFGWKDELAEWAHEFRDNSTRAYAVLLGRALEQATTPRGLHITLAALLLDGILTLFEGWALHRRRPWGAWVVVAVTGSLLPFEVFEMVRHFRWTRLVVLVVNVAVVAFLVVHARAQARSLEAEAAPSPPSPGGTGGATGLSGDEPPPAR